MDTGTYNDVMKKFQNFRLIAEDFQKKSKDNELEKEHLRDELKLSREVEKHLRTQLTLAQTRIIHLQKDCNEILSVKERSDKHDNQSREIEKKLKDLERMIKETQEKSKEIIIITSREDELIKQNEELKMIIKKKEADFDLLRMEIQTNNKEKNDQLNKNEDRILGLLDELQEARMENNKLISYRKQLAEYEQTIRQYEQERSSLLCEYQPSYAGVAMTRPKSSILKVMPYDNEQQTTGPNKSKVTWGDNTVSSYSDERSLEKENLCVEVSDSLGQENQSDKNNVATDDCNIYETDEIEEDILSKIGNEIEEKLDSKQGYNLMNLMKVPPTARNEVTGNMSEDNSTKSFVYKSRTQPAFKKPKIQGFQLKSKLQPLDFKTSTEISTQESSQLPRKRRLYSTNCNHYLN